MHLRVQRVAIPAPVGAENEHNISLAPLGARNRRGNVVMRIGLLIVNGIGGVC
jgi:hypothetical protein